MKKLSKKQEKDIEQSMIQKITTAGEFFDQLDQALKEIGLPPTVVFNEQKNTENQDRVKLDVQFSQKHRRLIAI